jgi:hypothetical protein
MKILCYLIFSFATILQLNGQTLPLGAPVLENYFRNSQLLSKFDSSFSFNYRPLNIGQTGIKISNENFDPSTYFSSSISFLNEKGIFKVLPMELRFNFDSHHPESRNNGAMIRSRGAQTLISAGIYAELGPLSVQLKPEFVFAENRNYDGFAESHYDIIWAKRYLWWNHLDEPERYGNNNYTKILPGQSSIRLNKWGLSLGISTENIWWGPGIRNSIMMSNNAQGFEHITFNTTRPIQTKIGNFEWQIVTGKLESSGFTPPDTSRTFAGTKMYRPKNDDWRYYQGFSFTYSPKWIKGLSIGATRWVQAYSEFIKETNDYFPAFSSMFRKDDDSFTNEIQRDQAAAIFFRWLWLDGKAEIYMEFGRNDASFNFRDLILNADHSRATTLGFLKLFDTRKKNQYIQVNWEWTQMEQTAGRLLRNAAAWYLHSRVRHGYTHNGEVIGASIGPGSNSHYLSVAWIKDQKRIGGAIERIAHDNDWFHQAFEDSKDWRRYWVDYNVHGFIDWNFDNFLLSANVIYSRSLNYQWELDWDPSLPYYVAGTDVGNLHLEFKIAYPLNFN